MPPEGPITRRIPAKITGVSGYAPPRVMTNRDFEKLVERFSLSLLLHGHSHIARMKEAGRGLIVNPGTPTIPNPSSPYRKTAGVFDSVSGIVEVQDIETGQVVLKATLGP